AIWYSIRTYVLNQRTRRGELLKALYEKFYEGEPNSKKQIRRVFDYGPQKLEVIVNNFNTKDVDKTPEEIDLEEKLADYLNFFEFIAGLKKFKHLKIKEVKALFNYYLYLL